MKKVFPRLSRPLGFGCGKDFDLLPVSIFWAFPAGLPIGNEKKKTLLHHSIYDTHSVNAVKSGAVNMQPEVNRFIE